jgi:predicted permease
MLTISSLGRKLRSFVRPADLEKNLEDEMRFHLEMEEAQHIRSGKTTFEARELSRQKFGSVERYKDECRDAQQLRFFEDLRRDVRFGGRTFLRNRGATVVTVLTLALGIGATTAIYGAVYGILLAPLPYADSDRIVTLWQNDDRSAESRDDLSPANYLDVKSRNRSFVILAAAEPYSFDFESADGAVRFSNARVTDEFFPLFGTRPLLGRALQKPDYVSGDDRVVVLSHRLWVKQFHSDSSIIGRTLVLDSLPRKVVGVMPRGFEVPHREDLWSPKIFSEEDRRDRTASYYAVFGRLRPSLPIAAAEREVGNLFSELARDYPRTNQHVGALLVSLPTELLGRARRALFVLLGAVILVLLVACANVANFQLAAAVRRNREFAIRTALGAGRTRLIRQLLTESLLLAIVGATAGIIFAQFGILAIRRAAPTDLPRVDELTLGLPVLLFGAILTIVTAVLFGLAPIVRATRLNLQQNLAADSTAATSSIQKRRLRSALVVAEVALALVLLVAAGLLGESFASLLRVDRGFRAEGVIATTLQAWSYYPTPGSRVGFVNDATSRLAALPGVDDAAMTSSLPLSERIGQESSTLTVQGSTTEEQVRVAACTPTYFATLDIPLRAGRNFLPRDDSSSVNVAIVNETLARKIAPDGNAIGRRITLAFTGGPRTREIVGIVGDVRHEGLHADPAPTVFLPHAQAPTGAVHLVVSSGTIDPQQLIKAVRRELRVMNRMMPVSDAVTLESLLDSSLRERRFNLFLLAAFAFAALVLAAVGIYGIMSSVTSERTHEIGIRMALGAESSAVLAMVLRQGLKLAGLGAAIGFVGAALTTGLLKTMLFRVTSHDPWAFLFGVVLLLAVAAVACFVPANRAARLNPARAISQS